MDLCPCESGTPYESCCQPLIEGRQSAPTAEALMRARYTAYARCEIPFLRASLTEEQGADFSEEETRRWAESSEWQGLEIVRKEAGTTDDEMGEVEFVARFREKNGDEEHVHHERALFAKVAGEWLYAGFVPTKGQTVRRETPKIGRNDPCPCGSGKKYKKCCGA